jgi:diguanylate cyclase (GGDEF)-like protein
MNPSADLAPPGLPPSLTDRLTSVFGWIIAGVSAAIGVSLAVIILVLAHFEPRTQQLREARYAVLTGHQAMLDEETGLRGFLISREDIFLDPLRAGRRALESANAELTVSAGADPELGPLLLDERVAEQRWTDEWARSVERSPTGADRLGATAAEGKALFDAYRVCEQILAAALNRRIAAIDAERRWTLAGGVLLNAAILMAMLAFMRRQRRRLRAVVTTPLARLLGSIAKVRDGRLDVQVAEEGTAELGHIARALNQMTAALKDERAQRELQDTELAAQAKRLRFLLESAREFSESLNLRYVLQSIGRAAVGVTSGADARIWLVDDTGSKLTVAYDSASPKDPPRGLELLDIGFGVEGRAAKYGRTVLEPPTEGAPDLVAASGFPMVVGARVVGVIAVRPTPTPRKRNPAIVEVLETLAMHAGAAIESARLHQQTEERSKRDALTTLYNRRRLDEDLLDEARRCARYQRPMSFIMIDVDHFKRYNDTHGHGAGDVALQRVADVLRSCVRTTDSVYRYGGEEFAVLARETSLGGAEELAERLRRGVAAHFAEEPSAKRLTVSLGVAQFEGSEPVPGVLLEAADQALYEAKRSGRNQVALASLQGVPISVVVPSETSARAAKHLR